MKPGGVLMAKITDIDRQHLHIVFWHVSALDLAV
jgi:hypothetical protein